MSPQTVSYEIINLCTYLYYYMYLSIYGFKNTIRREVMSIAVHQNY